MNKHKINKIEIVPEKKGFTVRFRIDGRLAWKEEDFFPTLPDVISHLETWLGAE